LAEPIPAPAGLRLRPDPGLTSLEQGRVLLGGSPYRLLRLGPAGARQVAAWWQGEPVPDAPAARALARRLLEAGMANPDIGPGRPGTDPPGGTGSPGGTGAAGGTGSPGGPGRPAPDDVTVVIPVRDRPAALARCLAGCRGLRVIVVDDGSAGEREVAGAAARAGARRVRLPASVGPGAARNAGLAQVTTPLVAFVDSDCVPAPGWLDPLLGHFADPAVAAVGPRIVADRNGTGGLAGGWLAAYEQFGSALDLGPLPSIVRPGARVGYLPTAALVVRRDRTGRGFAEDMTAGEDVDFVWRLAEEGWQVRYEPSAEVAHTHRVRFVPWFARRRHYGTSAAPLELRHPGRVPAVSMSGWSALAWLAAAAGQPAGAAAILAATTALLARRLRPVTGDPWPVALRLAGGGTVMAGRLLGSAVSRAWWPAAIPAAAALPRLRLPLAALVLAPPVLDWRAQRPPMDPVRYVTTRLIADVAYSLGVWQGCVANATARPLLPRLWWRSGRDEPGGPA
jgi:mycofactocin glycosyltransferase